MIEGMKKLLYSAEMIQSRVRELASAINRDLAGTQMLHVVVTMNGSFMFAADLCRAIQIPQTMHFTGGSYFKGAIKHEQALSAETMPSSFSHAPVLIIEDIMDNGSLVKQLRQMVVERHAGSIVTAALFQRMDSEMSAEHVAFTLPKELFVIGYGLDMDGRYRELRDVYALESMASAEGLC